MREDTLTFQLSSALPVDPWHLVPRLPFLLVLLKGEKKEKSLKAELHHQSFTVTVVLSFSPI